ncbi:MAG TPA: sigma-70 family RNA polymerase sigma factor [Kineosporiaceae bacterium]
MTHRSAAFVGWDDASLVDAARGSAPHAYAELFERWYVRCFDVAWNIVRNRETAADVAQDAFLACWEHLADLRDPAAFGGWALRTTRNRALHRLERERLRAHDPIDTQEPMAVPDPAAGPDTRAEQGDQRELVWTAAAALDPRNASLLDLHLRHGLGPAEIAGELRITSNNASQLLYRLRGQLRDVVESVLLWHRGQPVCRELARLPGVRAAFDAGLAAEIKRHRRRCTACTEDLARRTRPEVLFSSLPVAAAAVALKDQVRSALTQAGMPLAAPAAQPPALGLLGRLPRPRGGGRLLGVAGSGAAAMAAVAVLGSGLVPGRSESGRWGSESGAAAPTARLAAAPTARLAASPTARLAGSPTARLAASPVGRRTRSPSGGSSASSAAAPTAAPPPRRSPPAPSPRRGPGGGPGGGQGGRPEQTTGPVAGSTGGHPTSPPSPVTAGGVPAGSAGSGPRGAGPGGVVVVAGVSAGGIAVQVGACPPGGTAGAGVAVGPSGVQVVVSVCPPPGLPAP